MAYNTAPPLRGLDDPQTVAYLAGLLDNRGGRIVVVVQTAGCSQPSYGACVALCSTDRGLMDWMVANIGGAFVVTNVNSGSLKWRVFGVNAERLLRAIRPHLVRHARQADLTLMLRDLDNLFGPGGTASRAEQTAREVIYHRVKSLNSNGRHPWDGRRLVMPDPVKHARTAAKTDQPAKLVADVIAGHSLSETARRHHLNNTQAARLIKDHTGLTYSQLVHKHGHAHKTRVATVSDGLAREIARAYTIGASCPQIAAELGVSVRTVSRVLKRLGIPRRPPGTRSVLT